MHFEMYPSPANALSAGATLLGSPQQWRWRLVAGNGRTIANGGEAFHNEADCLQSMGLVASTTTTTQIRKVPQ